MYVCVMYTRMHMASQCMHAYDVLVCTKHVYTYDTRVYGMRYVNMTSVYGVHEYVCYTYMCIWCVNACMHMTFVCMIYMYIYDVQVYGMMYVNMMCMCVMFVCIMYVYLHIPTGSG